MHEEILIQGVCNRIKGAFVENGHGMLTNQRFIYSKHKLSAIIATGTLVNLMKGDFEFDIPVDTMDSVSEKKRLMSKTLVIRTKQGEEYQFYFTKNEEWKIHFNNLLHAQAQPNTEPENKPPISVADELLKYKSLLDAGVITKEEFDRQKEKLLK